MQLQIKAQGLDLSDSTRIYTEDKVGKLDRYIEENHRDSALADIHLLAERTHTKDSKDECRITISGLGGGQSFHAEAAEPEMHVAIDSCVQVLEEQLRRHHDKQRDHINRDAAEAKQQPVEDLMETDPVDLPEGTPPADDDNGPEDVGR